MKTKSITKGLLSILFIAVILSGCEVEDNYCKMPTAYHFGEGSWDAKIYVIDSCEYIGIVRGSQNDWLTHKGNCKFCIERNKK